MTEKHLARDEKGRIAQLIKGFPQKEIPARDSRSERDSKNPGLVCFKIPKEWYFALKTIALERQVPMGQVIVDAIAPVLLPRLNSNSGLRDRAHADTFGLNPKAPRLSDQKPSDVMESPRGFDHMQRAAEQAGFKTQEDWREAGLPIQGRPGNQPGRKSKLKGTLTDKR